MTEPDGEHQRPKRGRWLVVAALVLGSYIAAIAVIGIADAEAALTRASLSPLLGALGLQVVVVGMWAGVYRASVRALGGDLRPRQALAVSMPAFTLSHSLPGGGWVGNAVAVNRITRYGMSGPPAAASVALTATISLTTVAALGAAGIVFAFLGGDLPDIAVIVALPVLLSLIGLVAVIIGVLRSPESGDRVIGALGRLHRRLREHADEWRSSLRDVTEDPPSTRRLLPIAGWALVKWSADIAALALVFVAFGQTPRVSALLVAFGVSQLATAVPVTPGGLGFVEGGMVGAFVTLGLTLSTATAIVLAYRVLATWLPVLAGVPVLVRGGSVRHGTG